MLLWPSLAFLFQIDGRDSIAFLPEREEHKINHCDIDLVPAKKKRQNMPITSGEGGGHYPAFSILKIRPAYARKGIPVAKRPP